MNQPSIRRYRSLLFFALSFLGVSSGVQANVISNPSFESGSASWNLGGDATNSIVSAPVNNGSNALRMICDGDGVDNTTGKHDVKQTWIGGITAGQEYVYTAWAKGIDIQGVDGGSSPLLLLNWRGRNDGASWWPTAWAGMGTYDWKRVSINLQAPPGTTRADVQFTSWFRCTGGEVFWDDVSLIPREFPNRGTLLETRQVGSQLNPDFLQGGVLYKKNDPSTPEPDPKIVGWTGSGYFDVTDNNATLAWGDIPQGTNRTLSFRYSWEGWRQDIELFVNNVSQGIKRPLETGWRGSWASLDWDNIDLPDAINTVRLKIGKRGGEKTQPLFDRMDIYGLAAPLTAPGNVNASDGDYADRVAVTWNAVAQANAYEVYRSSNAGSNGVVIASLGNLTSYNDTTAAVGTTYYYAVKACNSGCGNASAQDAGYRTEAVPTTPPSGVTATDGTSTDKVTVTWNAAAGASNYKVYRSTVSGSPGSTPLAPSVTATSYDDTSATPGTTYFYSIKACNSGGCSSVSAENDGYRAEIAPTIAPNGVSATGNLTDKVTVTWNAVGGAGSYRVYRSTSIGATGDWLPPQVNGTSYDDTGATPGTTYYYSVTACNTGGCSASSAPVAGLRAEVPPTAAPSINATDDLTDKVTVTWNAVGDASSYEIYRSTSPGTPVNAPLTTLGAVTSYDDTSAATGSTYYYNVKACNSGGCSTFSAQETGIRIAAVPNIPTNVTASDDIHTNRVSVDWDLVPAITRYEVYRSTVMGNDGELLASSTDSNYEDTSAIAGEDYYYSVRACNATGCSELSDQDAGRRKLTGAPAPIIAELPTITVQSTGPFTPVALGEVVAQDATDGDIPATADKTGPFESGRHIINWSATNNAGKTGTAQQEIVVLPRADFQPAQIIGEGGTATVAVHLSGPAADYPVTIPYIVSGTAEFPGDHDSVSSNLVINQGTVGQITINITDDGIVDPNETVEFSMGTPSNAVKGISNTHALTITEENLAPRVQLSATQSAVTGYRVTADSGNVTITAVVDDPNQGDTHSFDWSMSDNALVPVGDAYSSTFTFEPTALTPGVYTTKVTVADNGSPAKTTMVELMVRVDASRAVLSATTDSDGDGADDAAEGNGDNDGDGVPDYLDAIDDPAVLQGTSDDNAYLLQVNAGLSLKLGETATASGQMSATVTEQNIADFGGNGGSVANAEDDGYTYPGGIYDFEVGNLPTIGQSVDVVIAVKTAIPGDAVYRKYSSALGWQDFTENGSNKIKSAPGNGAGFCPPPGNSSYANGLTAGHWCVQLTIEDGGPNDTDGIANGVVRDPSGVTTRSATPAPNNTTAQDSGGGGGTLHIMSLLILVMVRLLPTYSKWRCSESPKRNVSA